MSITILCSIDAKNPGGGIVTLLFSSRSFSPTSGAGYDDRILQLPIFRREISIGARLGGEVSQSYDSLKLDNVNGDLDYLRDWGLAGQTATFLIGLSTDTAVASFVTLYTAKIEQALFDLVSVEITFRDRLEDLRQPIQTSRYGGTNVLPAGVDGTDDIKGQPKPKVFGAVSNITPVCVNTDKLIFQATDTSGGIAAGGSGINVFDKGVQLTQDADYTSQANMEATARAAGHFSSWPAGGMFRVGTGAAANGSITCDISISASFSDETVAQIAQDIVTGPGGISGGDVTAGDVTYLDSVYTGLRMGVYVKDEGATFIDALDPLFLGISGWYGFDRLGKFRMGRLETPASSVANLVVGELSTTVLDSDDYDIEDLRFLPTKAPDRGKPVWRVSLNYYKNWTIQQGDRVATSVTAARRNFLELEFRTTSPVDNTTTQTNNPLAQEKKIDSLFLEIADANAEATRMLGLLDGRQDFIEVDLEITPTVISTIDIGKGVTLTVPRFGYTSGKVMLVTGIVYNPGKNLITLSLWGVS